MNPANSVILCGRALSFFPGVLAFAPDLYLRQHRAWL